MPGYIYQNSTSDRNDFTASQIVRAPGLFQPEHEAPRFGVRSAAAPLHILSPEVFSPFDLFFLPFFLNLLVDAVLATYKIEFFFAVTPPLGFCAMPELTTTSFLEEILLVKREDAELGFFLNNLK